MGTQCDKISVWPDADSPGTTIENSGHITDSDGTRQLKLSRTAHSNADLPQDLEDWQVTITTTEGEHVHGEIVNTRVGGLIRHTVAPIAGLQLQFP